MVVIIFITIPWYLLLFKIYYKINARIYNISKSNTSLNCSC